MSDELFCKRLPISLKSPDREDRKVSINVAVEMHQMTTPVHRKELVIRLTDESDLFFLYTLQLGEEDFQSLKAQQGLLVDFGAFPQRFIDLLQMVLQEEHKESPKFILEFVCAGSSGLGGSTAILNVIETNPFKHLTHLALKFLPGTDSDIKKYLADCLKNLKDQNSRLMERFEHTEGDLSGQLRAAREALASRTTELDQLKTEWSNRTANLSTKHQQELTSEKEKALEHQTMMQQRIDRERRELEQMHSKAVKHLETRLYELEASNKDLTDRRYNSEATIRELRSKLGLLEDEHQRTLTEVQTLRKSNSGLDAGYHEQDKLVHQLKTKLAVLEQELKDKDELLQKTSESVVTEKDQKGKLEENAEREKRKIAKLEMSLKTMTEELVKGNEIIKRLQGDIKNYHAKLKLRNQVTTEQEKLLGEKNKEMEEMRRDLESTKTMLNNKESENNKLNDQLETTVQKLEESRQLLKTNENVIQWLNKQVTEVQLGQQRPAVGPFEMNSTASTVASSASNYRHHTSHGMSSQPGFGTAPGHLSNIVSTQSSLPSHSTHQQSLRPPRPQPQVHYVPNAMRKSGLPAPIAKSSPVGTIPEEQEVRGRVSPHASPPHLKNTQSDGVLDARYFQRSDEVPLQNPGRPVSPGSLIFSHGKHQTTGASNPKLPSYIPLNAPRLSKDLIAPRHTAPPSGRNTQHPPLASAYFPGPAKVS